jgi:lipooligosaccharide transport system permease protein
MTLFSATFYPLAALPAWLHWIGWISPLWHAAETGRVVAFGQPAGVGVMVWHVGYLAVLIALGWWSTCFLTRVQLHGVGWFSWLPRAVSDPADRVLARVWRVLERVVYPGSRRVTPGAGSERLPGFLVGGPPPLRRTWAGPFRVLNRDLVAMRQFGWMPVLTGFFEPVLYLWSMGLGLGGYMGDQPAGGLAVPYPAFIAPALLATSAMNGAIFDSTTNVFFKLHEIGTYKGMLATPLRPRDVALGELTYALLRGLAYSVAFFIVAQTFDLALSWWAVLAIPAATLVAFGFASLGFAITSFLTSYRQVDWIGFTLVPMFLLSGTFFPLADLPVAVQAVVQVFPLQHAVELIRGLMLGTVGWPLLAHAAYFVVLGIIGPIIASRRITKLFLD